MLTNNELETITLGETIGKRLEQGMCLALYGDLAGGKTTFTKGIGRALNISSVINSPTFTILKIYQGDLTLYHIDAYRLENNDYDLGFDEYLEEGVTVVEWPQFYSDYLPNEYLEIHFNHVSDNQREITFVPHGEKYVKIVEDL